VRPLYLLFGILCMVVGIIGIFVPVLPTTPFLLLAAFFFSRSSDRLHRWMLDHPRLGPPIRLWQDHGVVSSTAKRMATTLIILSWCVTTFVVDAPRAGVITLTVVLAGVLLFIWTRPSKPARPPNESRIAPITDNRP
jgi:uncharacterized membrane protein YbaN (DUF454 family)